jgi:Xaa-Pro aminopeptidase
MLIFRIVYSKRRIIERLRSNTKSDESPELVYNVLQARIAAVKPGVRSSEVNKIVRENLTEAGYVVSFFCALSTGHRVGMNAPEIPWQSFAPKTSNESHVSGRTF